MSFLTNKLFRFCLAGGVVALVDLGLVRLLVHVLPPLVAVSTAYLWAVGLHFCLNRWWVFAATQNPAANQFVRYAMTVCACLGCTLGMVALAMSTVTSSIMLAKIIAIPPVTLLGFVLMRMFVFRVSPAAVSNQYTG
jgi:putative flippase GtrA